MAGVSALFDYLRSRSGRRSLAVVLVCAILLAYFGIRTYLAPLPKSYPLDFGGAEWISSTDSSIGYFRKVLYLDGEIKHGWIQVAGSDSFNLYVNEMSVARESYDGTCPSGLYDLKPFLRHGRNVIAIHVVRSSYPGTAQVLVRGACALGNSPPAEFVSDRTWKASKTPDGIVGGLSWRSPLLDHTHWKDAPLGRAEDRPATVHPLRHPADLVQTPPSTAWVGCSDVGSSSASFRTTFAVPPGQRDTWLRIAATGAYDVLVNERLAISEPERLQDSGKAAVPLFAYNINGFTRSGNNSLVIRVRSGQGPAALLLDGATFQNGAGSKFGADETWMATTIDDGSAAAWRSHAVILGQYDEAAWQVARMSVAKPKPVPGDVSRSALSETWIPFTLAVVLAVLFLWLIAGAVGAALTQRTAAETWTADAVSHFCLVAFLLLLLLLSFDIRFTEDWCFQPSIVWSAAAFLLASKILVLFKRGRQEEIDSSLLAAPLHAPRVRLWQIAALLAIMAAGFWIRYAHLTDISLDVDEMGPIQYSKGILQTGTPYIQLGSFTKPATTYELMGYPLALARFFLGSSERSLRLPSLIFSTITIGLIWLVGVRLLDWRAGLISAFIYTFHPASIYWGRNAFWPSQAQMIVLFTAWCFYEAIQTQPFRRGYLTAAALGFVCSYLTWEGSGFVLPALFVGMLLHRPGNYGWLRDWHLWRCLFLMTVVVLLQLCRRQLVSIPPYLQTGTSLSEVSTPQVVYLDPTRYDPTYYLRNFAFLENNITLTLIMLLGLPFCWKHRSLRYVYAVMFTLFVCYTHFLPAYTLRYCYHYQTLLILAAVGILVKAVDGIGGLAFEARALFWPRPLAWTGGCAAVAVLLLATNEELLRAYRLSGNESSANYAMRARIYRNDYRGAAHFVKERWQPGDALIVAIPHIFEHYSQLKVDCSLNTMVNKKTNYDGALDVPRFIDKHRGYPCLRNMDDLQSIHHAHRRVWVVLVPFGPNDSQSPEVEAYLAKHQKIVFESYHARVVLLEGTHPITENGNSPVTYKAE